MNGWHEPERQVELSFDTTAQEAGTHVNLSGVRAEGEHLWIAGDETATVERLTAISSGPRPDSYANHLSVRLADLVDLPGAADDEADVEGLARSGDWLWAVGSHSLKRRRIKETHSDDKARKRLARVVREENRYTLLRLAVVTDPVEGPRLVRSADVDGRRLTSAVLGGRGDAVTDLLAHDRHLKPFLKIPGKDNGIDIEGIAVHNDRLYLGLRGPVLRGWATLLEIRPVTDPEDEHRLVAAPLDGPDGQERYRTHFLDLGGLGIRDLCPHGDDLLLLVGPSMSLSGPIRVVRWRGGCVVEAADVVRADELQVVMSLPHGDGADHAEGITLLDDDHLLVVYDSPAPARLTPNGVLADVMPLKG